jgi:hypothetical protein
MLFTGVVALVGSLWRGTLPQKDGDGGQRYDVSFGISVFFSGLSSQALVTPQSEGRPILIRTDPGIERNIMN